MNKVIFDYMLEDADNFNTGDLWMINIEDKNWYFDIKNKTRWYIEAYSLEEHQLYKIKRNK